MKQTIYSGGGSYHDQIGEDSIQIWRWIELNQQFRYYSQIIFDGKYINGKKQVDWIYLISRMKNNYLNRLDVDYIMKQMDGGDDK
ncbi:unnamed protein product [Paramecium pentaurelia]|uniref:Uncharacterized protein n=1 Tax=Paramecium pentaurelia TaxID=43138 RepID=A0A8S1YLS8_9CILI|nr:unnamed protein product [Paramecium pentaurelia]